MFTGIVQTKASVVSVSKSGEIMRLVLSTPNAYLNHLDIGASISINGCCLTVVEYELGHKDVVGQVHFDVIDESLKLTNLGKLKQGEKVNFERSVTFGTELGGHIVSGHIHTVAKLTRIEREQDNCAMFLSLPEKWLKYINYKGFISVNGCSLTVGEVTHNGFYLHLIPETLEVTNLGLAHIGSEFNIEVDQQTYTIVETIERYMKAKGL
ncbi:Riboflavin synthase [Pseudoalteromonas sp. P1-9]|uniref:riboflavin synthase n=1 Tax=Pseudoalteromonas sp. P1-9 TaxID=1710354 RepID=UPI0006D60FA3|nr:riboflavin synthase [Pseudoalteromonas sp. P1-9]KPV95287.1 Riboflavin synthase [Pseudoalteromonas sp. P1-9]